MELLERERFLAELETALAEAMAGSGRIALVSGEAGIGKTTLVDAFARRQAPAVRVLWGGCDSLSTPRPLGPLHDMATQLQGSLPALLQSGSSPGVVFPHMLVELQRSPAIAVFEDIHWADEATLDLLRYLGRRVTRTHALLILTYRDDELGLTHPLRGLLGDLASSAARRIELPPLSETAVRKLVGKQSVNAADLHQRTEGNPFFVTEVLARPAAGEPAGIPATIRDAVLARVAHLSPAARRVLEAASVIGMRIEPWLLADLAGEDAHAVDEAIAAGMLVFQGEIAAEALSFRHELARVTIHETLVPIRRRELHRLVLHLLESSPITRSDLRRLAHHAGAAGDSLSVLQYAPAAARQAEAASAYREAAALYELACKHAGQLPVELLPEAEHAQMLLAYGEVCHSIDDRVRGIQVLRQALEIWRRLDRRLELGATLAVMGRSLIGLGQEEEAELYGREAIQILETCPPGRELAHAYRVLASQSSIAHRTSEAIAWAEKSIALSTQIGDLGEAASAQSVLGIAWMRRDFDHGCRLLENSRDAAILSGRKTVAALAYANLGSVSGELFELHRSIAYLEEGLAYTAQHDLDRLRFFMKASKSMANLFLGRWDQAAEEAQEVIFQAQRSTTSRFIALISLGRLRARQGNPEAGILLDDALKLAKNIVSLDRLGPLRTARAEAAWLEGDPQQARQEALTIFELAVNRRHPWYAGELAFWLWKTGEMPPLPEWLARPFALQIGGDWHTAAVEWERLGCPYEQARALADGDTAAQVAALEIFERLSARSTADALRRTLRQAEAARLPRKPRVSTRQNPYHLTDREMEILELLVDGFSNADIAEQLKISMKTADHHVSAILSKLGVHSRREVAGLFRPGPPRDKK